ncbi:MAG: TniB family NTP-binding protein [Paraglaciecola sp.]|uniref:TniB family NTP-binding protein n=1 Tax=Paraglaciecola sp. TaxID=1920173 RepID=UPI00273FDA63|nr:TniB family NTP-binding protein [Paraglaciecola sp.]MDP5032700.1 TniB family NTP-binding protein [Paraglaciecola sp.]MDP5130716.1 TniB family NTP-binding protein [Paraglaciecola sp.]
MTIQHLFNEEKYITSHITQVIRDKLHYCLRSTRRKSPSGVIIEGPTGVGKTTTCEREMMLINQDYVQAGHPPPIYIVKSPTTPGTKQYLSKILVALGDHSPYSGTEQNLQERVIKQLRLKQVKVLIFDEFQQLIEKRSDGVIRHTLDDIKSISDDNQIACIFVGVHGVNKIAKNNEQAASRFAKIIRINYMGFDSPKWQKITRKFMAAYFKAHSLDISNFGQYELCLRLYAATNGDLRLFVDLLDEATGFLTDPKKIKPLTLKSLNASYQFLVREVRKTKVNPFTASIEAIETELKVEDYSKFEKESE